MDVAQFSMFAGKVYLSLIIDCFDGMSVSWAIRTNSTAEMVETMLEDTCSNLADKEPPMIHSDWRCHYRWSRWIKVCQHNGLVHSMSRKGRSPDNSTMEGFFGKVKQELFCGQDWNDSGIDEFMTMLDDYMKYCRNVKIKVSMGWMSLMQNMKSLGFAA